MKYYIVLENVAYENEYESSYVIDTDIPIRTLVKFLRKQIGHGSNVAYTTKINNWGKISGYVIKERVNPRAGYEFFPSYCRITISDVPDDYIRYDTIVDLSEISSGSDFYNRVFDEFHSDCANYLRENDLTYKDCTYLQFLALDMHGAI